LKLGLRVNKGRKPRRKPHERQPREIGRLCVYVGALGVPLCGSGQPKAGCAGQAGQISFDFLQKQTERSCSELAATEAHLIGSDGAAS